MEDSVNLPEQNASNASFPISEGEMLKLILESFPARIFWKDRQSRFLGGNEKVAQDAGVGTVTNMIGKTDYDMPWKKEEADFFVQVDERVMSSGTPELGIVEPQLRADGKKSWIETNKIPLVNKAGDTIGILGTYHDITERIESQKNLEKYARELEIKNRELEQFAYIAAHDLQEPLRTTLGSVHLLEDAYKEQLDSEGQLFVQYIKDSTKRMLEMVTGVLEYSTMGRDIKIETVNSHTACLEATEDLKHAIEASGAILTISDDLPVIQASKVELRMLFQNLIGNALKFKRPGVTPQIEINHKGTADFWCFSVCDNGIGIHTDYREQVFKIFQRLHNRSDYEGTGMGLANCHKIVELFGGQIWFDSKEGEGTNFHFTLRRTGNDA